MSVRFRLPNRRASEFFHFESMGMKFTASVSRDADGEVRELFVDNHKAGSGIGTLVRDAASSSRSRSNMGRTSRRSGER
jgi:hypothetical protein